MCVTREGYYDCKLSLFSHCGKKKNGFWKGFSEKSVMANKNNIPWWVPRQWNKWPHQHDYFIFDKQTHFIYNFAITVLFAFQPPEKHSAGQSWRSLRLTVELSEASWTNNAPAAVRAWSSNMS